MEAVRSTARFPIHRATRTRSSWTTISRESGLLRQREEARTRLRFLEPARLVTTLSAISGHWQLVLSTTCLDLRILPARCFRHSSLDIATANRLAKGRLRGTTLIR